MEFIISNWYVIFAVFAVGLCIGVAAYRFAKMPTSEQLQKVREWLLYAVTEAEREFGGGTGQIKLVEHSIHVYERLRELYMNEKQRGGLMPALTEQEEETVAICGLLHDICKVNFYTVEMRNRKNDKGQWEKHPFYVVDDQLPYGHGEKSVYIVSGFMRLSREEAMAIRWHMGFSDNDFKAGGYSVGNAFDKFPLAVMTHIADLMASHLDECAETAK